MKILTTVLILIISSSAFAQWANIWTNNSTNFQGGCFATSKDTCFAANYTGKIYKTTNGGATWDSVQTIFNTSWFCDIYFPSKNIGYACGGTNFGTHTSIIAKTTNGGVTWDSLTSNSFGYEFTQMSIVNDTLGFFGGDLLVKTTDGGQTFSNIPLPFSTLQVTPLINALYFFDSDNGLIATREYVSSSKIIYRIALTADGGMNWTTTHIDSSISWQASKNINAIAFRNIYKGYAVGDNGTLLTSLDGGLNWSTSSPATDTTTIFTDIELSKNSLIGYIVGWESVGPWGAIVGRIYKTTDGGFSWQANFTTSNDDGLYSISMATDDTVYATSRINVFKTSNGGANFINDGANYKPSFLIYPNPASAKIHFNNTGISKIEIFDLTGRILIEKSVTGTNEVDISELPNGIYIIKMKCKTSFFVSKMIKQ